MILGLNITISVLRRAETLDSVGGAVYTQSTVISGVRARLGNASRSQQMTLKEMGYESLRANQIVAQPSNLDVRENDLIQCSGGQYDGVRFLVRSVRKDNLLPGDPRSHVELLCERLVEARANP